MVSPTGKPSSLVICYGDGVFSLQIANTSGGTMSGAMLTVSLPPGCIYSPGSITGATQFNISNLNQPVFSLPDIANNTAHAVSYNAGLVCGYSNTQNFLYSVNYNSSNYTGFETPLQNYYYPEPVITNVTPSAATIPVNTTVVRSITIQQQGSNSSMDTLWLLDQHTADIQVISVSIGTLHYYVGASATKVDTIILTGSDLPGGNGLFDAGETIIIQETVKLVGCTNGQSTLKASWGCYDQICNFYSAFPTVSPTAGTTSMAMAYTNNNKGWGFIDNRGWVEFTLTNNGTGAGTAFNVVALAGFSSGGSTYYPNANWINKIDTFSINGFKVAANYSYSAGAVNGQYAFYLQFPFMFDPDGAGFGLEDADADGYYDDLPIGKTIQIKAHCYYSWTQAQSTIPIRSSCGNGWTNSAYQSFRYGYDYKNQCNVQSGVNWVANGNLLMFHTYDTRTSKHTIPPDFFNGVTVWMEQEVVTSTVVSVDGCPNDSVVYKLVLPRGILIGTGTATFKGVSMGTPTTNGDSVFYQLSRTRILSGGLFRVPLVLDCSLSPLFTGYVHAELKFYCDKINFPARYFTYWCSNSPNFWMQCPMPDCPEPSISLLKVSRKTLGWTNKNLTTKISPSTAGIRLDNAMSRDTIKIEAAGRINGGIDSLYFRLKHDAIGGAWGNQLFFDYVADTLFYFDVETSTWFSCSGLSPQATNGTTSTLTTYFGHLTSPGNCLSGLSFSDGDSVYYVVYGKIKNIAQTEWRTVPLFRGNFFWKNNSKENSCDSRGSTFNVLGSNYPAVTATFYQQIILTGCNSFQYEGLYYRSLESCGGDPGFPNEVRPFVVLDTLIFTLPEGFAYQAGSSLHYYRNDNSTSGSEVIADPIIDVSAAGTKLIYIRSSSWSYSDYDDCSNNYERILFYASPSCKATGDYTYQMDGRGRYQFMADRTGMKNNSVTSKGITYTPPLMSLTRLITTAEGREDTVVWKVSVCNQRAFQASNSWFAFESPSNGIQVTDVKDITNPVAPISIPVATYGSGKYWSQLGNFSSMACKTYQIRAVYTSCSYDSLLVRRGYNCASYPLNPELGYPPSGYMCSSSNTYLYLDPKDVSLNLSVTSPANPVNLCDTLEYEVQVTNSQPATAYNLSLAVSLPPGTGIMSGHSVFKFPYTTGSYVTVSDPVNLPLGSDKWVYQLSLDPNAVVRLKGVDSIPKNGYRLKFRLLTDCNFISGTHLKFTAIATNACGDEKERTSFAQPILITGLPTNTNLYVLNTTTDAGLHTCSSGSLVHVKVINLGPASISNIEKLSVSIDDGFDYLSGSLVNVHNGPSGLASNSITGGTRYLYFAIEPNLAVNDSIVFDFQLHDVDPGSLICDTIPLVTSTLLVGKVYCTLTAGDSCVIQSITASMTTMKPVIKDYIGFGSYTATSVPNGTTGEMVTVSYKVKNTGADTLQSSTINVVFVHDANNNGLPDETGADSLFFQSVAVPNLLPGDSVLAVAVFPVPAGKVCRMIAAIRLSSNPCSCNDDLLPINNIKLYNAGIDQQVCQQTNLNIGTPGITGYSYIWVPSSFLTSNTISDPVFNYNSILNNSITLTYSLITTRPGNCFSRDTTLVTVLPASTSYAGADTTICEISQFLNNKAVAANYSNIAWQTTGTGSFNDTTLLRPLYTPSTLDIQNGSVYLTMVVAGLCGSSTDQVKLSFSRQATAFAGKDTAICESWSYANLDATSTWNTGIRWHTLGDGSFNDTTQLHPVYTPGNGDKAAGFVRLVLKSLAIAPCQAPLDTMVLTLNEPPLVTNSPPEKEICSTTSTNISITANQPGTTFSWSATLTSGNVSGFSDGAGGSINQVLTNPLSTPGVVTYHITPNNAGCPGLTMDFPVTVDPLPTVINAPPDTGICSNGTTNILLLADVAGSLFSWSASATSPLVSGFSNGSGPIINQSLINSGYEVDSVNYRIIPSAEGCLGDTFSYHVKVFPVPDLSNSPASSQQCNNLITAINLTSQVSGTLFTWTAVGSSPQVSGFSNNPLPSSTINQVIINNAYTAETVTYTLTPQANGCFGPPEDFIVTVFPTPDLANSPLTQSQCNTIATGINLTSHVSGTLFTWIASGTTPQVSGFTSNGVPSLSINDILTNSGFAIDTAIYRVIPSSSGCMGPEYSYKVAVYPTPDLANNPLFMQVCNNTPTNQLLVSNVPGTLFTWSCTPSSGNVTGYNNSLIPEDSLNQTLINSGMAVESVTYHMTPHANGCDGVLTDYPVTVVSSPDVYFNPPSQTLCSGVETNIAILSHVPGTTFTWTAASSSSFVSGFSAGSGDTIKQVLTNTDLLPHTVTYVAFPTAFGCPPGIANSILVTVNPRPAITNSIVRDSICSSTLTNLVLESSIPGSTFSWLATGSSGNVSGYSGGSGLVIVQNLVNTGFNNEQVTYQVTPEKAGCRGDTSDFFVLVYPVPDVYFTPSSETICSAATTNIANHSHVPGASYSWVATGSTYRVSGYGPGSGPYIQQQLFNSEFSIEQVTYLVSPTANGCPGIGSNVLVNVNPAPVVTLTTCTDSITVLNAQPLRLSGGRPIGGKYKGTGVDSLTSTFYPALAGTGIHPLWYSYTNQFGCKRTDTLRMVVLTNPAFNCGDALLDVRDNKSYPTVSLGSQCWMAANLDFGNLINSSLTQRNNCVSEKYCFNNNPVNCSNSGGFYQWDEIMQYQEIQGAQGICPPAWHLPTQSDWNTLFSYYLGSGFAGSPLKSTGYSGYNALLSGTQFMNRGWSFSGFATMIWSSVSHGSEKAWAHGMNDYNPSVSYYPSSRSNAFPVRCIKD